MNIFFRELKAYKWGLFFWCIGMVALVGSSIAKFAGYSTSGTQSLTAILDQFPKSFQVLFGLTGFDLTKISGFVGVTFMYIALMATIHAVLLGAGIISQEERDRTSEFLLSKPVSRFKVILSKLSAGIFNLIILNLVTLVSLDYFANIFGQGKAPTEYIVALMAGLLFMQLLFFLVGTTVAAVSSRPKLSASVASGVLLIAFILTYFVNLNQDLDNLKYLTPFKYFDARDIIIHNSLDWGYMLISVALITVMLIVTFRAYRGRDMNV